MSYGPDQMGPAGVTQEWKNSSQNMFNNASSKGSIANHLARKGRKGKKGKKGGATTGYVMSSQTASILKNNFLK